MDENPQLKPYMRIALYPLLVSLKISASAAAPLAQANPELAVLLAGAIASASIGLAYFGIPTPVVGRAKMEELVAMLASLAAVVLLSIVAELLALDALLALSTTTYVVGFATIGGYTLSLVLSRIRKSSRD